MVYVVQMMEGRNITPAADYGEPIVLLPAGDVALSPGPTTHRLRRSLKNFSDKDWLLLMGDPVAIGMAAAVAARINDGRVNMLRWDRQSKRYFPVRVDVSGRVEKN
jgi:hypothetical protein